MRIHDNNKNERLCGLHAPPCTETLAAAAGNPFFFEKNSSNFFFTTTKETHLQLSQQKIKQQKKNLILLQIDKIKKICKTYNISLIEDAAEALGSFYKNKHLGTFGLVGILSFNGNKIVTAGCGGAIITNKKKLAKKLLHLSKISKIPHQFKYNYNEVGYNYQMPNLNAALGYAQIKKINYFLKLKRKLFIRYKKNFAKIDQISLFKEPKKSKSNYWLQTIILEERNRKLRDYILKKLNNNGIGSRPIWSPLHKVNYLNKFPRSELEITMEMNDRIINIPSSAFL